MSAVAQLALYFTILISKRNSAESQEGENREEILKIKKHLWLKHLRRYYNMMLIRDRLFLNRMNPD